MQCSVSLHHSLCLAWLQIMDELVKALMGRYPDAVLQFEDFNMEHATPLLERYRDHHLCFNDDIQVYMNITLQSTL